MIVKAVRHFGGKGAAASFPSPLGGLVLLHLGLGSNPTSLEPPPSPPPDPRWPARTPSCSYPSRRGRQPMYNWPKVGGKRIITLCPTCTNVRSMMVMPWIVDIKPTYSTQGTCGQRLGVWTKSVFLCNNNYVPICVNTEHLLMLLVSLASVWPWLGR